MPRPELSPRRLLFLLGLLLAVVLLAMRWHSLSLWMGRSLEGREVRMLEIVEKDSWPLMRQSVDATEGSGWLAYRFYSVFRPGAIRLGGRAWGLAAMAAALAALMLYFRPLSAAVDGPAPLVLGGLLALAGSAWISIGAGFQSGALLPAFWLGWLLWAGWFLEQPTLRRLAAGAVLAAVVVHAHMLLVFTVPLTMLLVFALLCVPQEGDTLSVGGRLRRGFWAVFFVVGAAALSVVPSLLAAHARRPLRFSLKSPSAGLGDLLYQMATAPRPAAWSVCLVAALALAGLAVVWRYQRRGALLWVLAWIGFAFLSAKLRWGDRETPEYVPLAVMQLSQWCTPVLAATGLLAAARACGRRLPACAQVPAALVGALLLTWFVYAAPAPKDPGNPDWESLAVFLEQQAAPEDRILLCGPDAFFTPPQLAAMVAPFRHGPLFPRLTRFPSSPSLLAHLASDSSRLWVLRFGEADWPMPLKYDMETRAEHKGNFGGVELYEFPTAAYRNMVSGMHTQWRPKRFDLAELAKGSGLEVVNRPEARAVYMRTGNRLDLVLQVERAGTYNVRIFLANVSTSTGTLDFFMNDVLIHSANLSVRNEIMPSDFALYFQEGATKLALSAGNGGRFLLSRMEVGRNRLGLVPEIRHPRDVVFGQSIRFLGYSIANDVVTPGETPEISYYWESMRKLEEPLHVIVRCDHLADNGEFRRFSNDHDLMLGLVSPDSLVPGEILKETLMLDIPADAAELPYKMMLGMVAEEGVGTFRSDRALGPPRKLEGVLDHAEDRIQVGMIEVARLGKSEFILPRPMPRDPLIFKFTPEVDFIGFDLNRTALTGSVEFEVSLYFQCLAPLRKNYDVVTTVTGLGSRIITQDHHQPCRRGFYPTSLWEAGQKTRDAFKFRVSTADADRVDLNIALVESYPKPGEQPKQLGKMIQLRDFGLTRREKP